MIKHWSLKGAECFYWFAWTKSTPCGDFFSQKAFGHYIHT